MLSKKELFNAKASSQKIAEGLKIDVVNVGEYADTDKDGNPVTVSVFVDKDGTVFTSISKTVNEMLDMLDEFQSTLPREERQQYCTKNLFIFIQYRQ